MAAELAVILDVIENSDLSQWSKRKPSFFWTLPPRLNLTPTLGLFLSPAILIYSLKRKFFSLDSFVSTVAVFQKFHFIIILRSKIFVITS